MRWLPRTLVDGLGFPEGPVVLDDGRVAFTDIRRQCLWIWDGARASVLAETGGGPNGATLGADGALYVANNGGLNVGPHGYWHASEPIDGRVQRVGLDGGCADLIAALPGDEPHRPNDLCFGPDGALYVTDPRNWEDLANLKPGRIWRARPDGMVEQIAEVPHFCNGIAFGPDGRLYVARSIAMKVVALDVRADGSVGDPVEVAALPTGFPDGFCFAADGRMIVCGSMGDVIQVFDADGALIETIETGAGTEPTNCCLADGVLYVTLSGTGELVAIDVDAEPLPLHRGGLP